MDAMDQVREGMRVVDADGNELGTVETFKEGDPQAVTTEGQVRDRDGSLVDNLVSVFAGDGGVPQERGERLVRLGYVKIDNKGIFTGDRYVAADQLDRVADDTLWLKPGYQTAASS